MATVAQAQPSIENPEAHLVVQSVDWNTYGAMLRIVGDRHIRVTYDSGTMEVLIPSQKHEQASQLLGLFVPRLAEALEVAYEPLGMTTWRRRDAAKGLEPDQCYYIKNEAIVRTKALIDLEVDPPPDLAIEVDITRSSLDRMSIYAGLGVPEVWRFDGLTLSMWGLNAESEYLPQLESLSFPGLRPADVTRFVELGRTTDKIRWAKSLREWVETDLLPRRDAKR